MNRVVIRDWLPAPLSNGSMGHWAQRQGKLRQAQQVVWANAMTAQLTPVHGPVRVTITLVFPVRRRRDADNLHARIKGVLDGLVRGKWIDDDSTDVIDLVVKAVVDPGQMRTVIDLERSAVLTAPVEQDD